MFLEDKKLKLYSVLFCLLLGGSTVFGQCKNLQTVFLSVDESKRSGLVEKINLLVSIQKNREWEKLYEILPLNHANIETKEEYINRHKGYPITSLDNNFLDFIPKSIDKPYRIPDAEVFIVKGCGKWQYKDQVLEQYAYLKAYWQDEQWSVSEVLYDLPLHTGFFPCPH